MATDLIDAFRRLQRHERGQVVDALLAELTPDEWRRVYAASRPFHCDFIATLPIELVVHVFSHLDVAAPYRLRSVSKHWNHVLGSLHVLKAGLDQWYQGTVDLRGADRALCERKAKAIHAFRTGRPTSAIKIDTHGQHDEFLLAGNHLVLVPSRERYVEVLNLDTWQFRSLRGEAHEQLLGVFASDQIVAMTTYSTTCYVYELQGGQGPKKFSVPSTRYFTNVACCGHTIACVAHFAKHTSVFLWEYNTQRGRSFDISHGPDSLFPQLKSDRATNAFVAPIILPETETIIFFSFDHAPNFSQIGTHLAFNRYTYSGECIGMFRLYFPEVHQIASHDGLISFIPVNYNRSLFAMCTDFLSNKSGNASCLLRFDEKANDLRIWEGSELELVTDEHEYGAMAWWNDICYGFKSHTALRHLIAYRGTSDTQSYRPIILTEKLDETAAANILRPTMVNGHYVIRIFDGCAYVLFFDDDDDHGNGRRPKENGSFFDIGEVEVLAPFNNSSSGVREVFMTIEGFTAMEE